MSYFNSEQEAHMNYLASLSPLLRCWCGWDARGHCYNSECLDDQRCLADRLAAEGKGYF